MNARTPLMVGLVLTVSMVVLVAFVMTVTKDKFSSNRTYPVYADFQDANGIRWKTRVQIAGLDVGKIDEVTHVYANIPGPDGKLTRKVVARVKIRILKDFKLYGNARIRKAAESLLGDFRLDLEPGTPDFPELKSGDVIENVQSVSDLEEIQAQFRKVASNVNAITESFKNVLAGPQGEGSLKSIFASVEQSMSAIEAATGGIARVVEQNERNVNAVLRDIASVTQALAQYAEPNGQFQRFTNNLTELSGRLTQLVADDNEELVRDGTLESTVISLDETVKRLASIVGKIDDGEGTIGKVVNDPAIADKLEQTIEDTGSIIGGLARLQTEIELRSEYNVPFKEDNQQIQTAIKNTLALRIYPRPDKYYLLEAIADPRGKSTRTLTTTTVGSNTTTTEEQIIAFDDLKFSAQFAKRYAWLTLRFGIIENTGGVGFNIHTMRDNLEFRFDAFDFDRRDPANNTAIRPRMRGLGMYEFYNHLWFQAGLDDPLNENLFTWFAGGALRFTDDDLRSLLVVAPSP